MHSGEHKLINIFISLFRKQMALAQRQAYVGQHQRRIHAEGLPRLRHGEPIQTNTAGIHTALVSHGANHPQYPGRHSQHRGKLEKKR